VSRAVWLFFVRMYGKILYSWNKNKQRRQRFLLSLDLVFFKENGGYQEEGGGGSGLLIKVTKHSLL
jgi:hypothetical protein